jgi:hypothetical protein
MADASTEPKAYEVAPAGSEPKLAMTETELATNPKDESAKEAPTAVCTPSQEYFFDLQSYPSMPLALSVRTLTITEFD